MTPSRPDGEAQAPAALGAAPGWLLPDHDRAAAACWWLLALGGLATFGASAVALSAWPAAVGQVLSGAAIAALVGMFPLRIPKTKSSIAAGDILIFLLLLTHGPHAAVIAATTFGALLLFAGLYFAQQEADPRAAAEMASRERAEHAEREAAMAAQRLRDLELSDRRVLSAFADAAIGMALVSTQGRLEQVNPALCGLVGHDAEALADTPIPDLVDGGDVPLLSPQKQRLRAGEQHGFCVELRCRHARGREVWVSIHGSHFAEGASTEALMILQAFDVTARRVVERRLQHPACHDSLTDLANRGRRVDEGIETRAKLDRLAERGCGDVQGFRLSRPLAVEPVGAMLPGAR